MVYDNLSAMNAFADGMSVSAHNIANISTPNFISQQVIYDSGLAGNVIMHVDPISVQMVSNSDVANAGLTFDVLRADSMSFVNNTVDLAQEFTVQISTQHAFEANAIAISTRDSLAQSLYEQVNGPGLVSYKV